MLPSNQRLEADDVPIIERDDRLVVNDELVQIRLGIRPLAHVRFSGRHLKDRESKLLDGAGFSHPGGAARLHGLVKGSRSIRPRNGHDLYLGHGLLEDPYCFRSFHIGEVIVDHQHVGA